MTFISNAQVIQMQNVGNKMVVGIFLLGIVDPTPTSGLYVVD